MEKIVKKKLFAKFTDKRTCAEADGINLILKKETPAQVHSCNLFEVFKTKCFEKHQNSKNTFTGNRDFFEHRKECL